MPPSHQTLAALLGSRICHDLISPIGAISNGVELLQMSGASNSPELELISESVENANARIRFFRIAFGVATATQRIGRNEIVDILRKFTQGTRMKIDWHSEDDLARDAVKCTFLMIQCFEAAMPWGGEISVRNDGTDWTIVGQSERMKDISPQWQALSEPDFDGDIGASEVQFLLLPMLLQSAARRLTLQVEPTILSARF